MSLKVTPGKTQSTGIQFDIPGLFGRWRVQKNQKIDAATQGKTGGIFQKFKGGNTAEAAKEIVQLAAQLPKRTGLNYQASLLENIKIMSAHVLGTNWVKDADRNLLAAAIRQEACQAELANPRTAEKEARLREIQPQVQGLQRQIQALDQQIAEKQEKTPSAPTTDEEECPVVCKTQKVVQNSLTLIAKGSGKEVYSSSTDAQHVFYRPRMFKKGELQGEVQTAFNIGNTLRERGIKPDSLAIDYEEVDIDGDYAVKTSKMGKSLDKHLATTKTDLGGRLDLGWHLLSGVATLHAADRVHGDLKPDNFLIGLDSQKPSPIMQLSDFGKTQAVQDSRSKIAYTGNRLFAPPEGTLSQQGEVASAAFILIHLLENGDEDGITAILQGRGRTLVDMTRAVTPLSHAKFQEVHNHIDRLIGKLEREGNTEPGRLSNLAGLLKIMTHPDPTKRPTMAEALEAYPSCI